jgi:putative Ca2+/H+ antiporter (TMEM165/GDT1 family)
VWTVAGGDDDADGSNAAPDAEGTGEPAPSRSRLAAVAAAYFVAELGDKTQLATVTLATQRPAAAVWFGATAGIVGANAAAVVVGRLLHRRLPAEVLRFGAAGLFAVFGAVLIIDGVRG